ncbi:cell shape determination protein CcmA [Hahella sp. CCB-MM4]|uniref:bactofilin family protein n=1 Tax=Hahella sp. (strain CCB-MM4) TaxID=1926491 RepID=UPI000B9B924B|nr:polymer-forming cytoskeletal protein [Hahella sp. CCB-MM4]OZG70036.1 cell shape determination protein CcmA [Hahella sp. CCB-MM4]
MFGSKKSKPTSGGRFDTLIAKGTELKGDVTFSGGLHIDGTIEGQIRSAPDNNGAIVRISEAGEIRGNVVAPHVIINGTVHGDVYSSEHIELAPKASITGNVYYNLIEMAMGAEVNGNLVHQKDVDKPQDKVEPISGKNKPVKVDVAKEAVAKDTAPEDKSKDLAQGMNS